MMLEAKPVSKAAVGKSFIMPYYSPISPFSKDSRYLALVHQHHFELYDGDGKWIKELPLAADSRVWWSRKSAPLLYFRKRNQVWMYNVETEHALMMREFAKYANVDNGGECDISEDGEHLVLSGDDREIFVYNVQTEAVTPAVPPPAPFNSLYITPENNVLVGTYGSGVVMLEAGTMRNLGAVAPSLQHQDVGRDTDGAEVLVRFNGDDMVGGGCKNGVEKVRLAERVVDCIWQMGWAPVEAGKPFGFESGGQVSYAGHVSCFHKRAAALVSIYSPYNVGKSGVYIVEYKRGEPELVCLTNSTMIQVPDPDRPGKTRMAYNPTPRAALAFDDSRFVFATNDGDTSRGENFVNTKLVKFPTTTPVPPPPPPPSPIIVGPDPGADEIELSEVRILTEGGRLRLLGRSTKPPSV